MMQALAQRHLCCNILVTLEAVKRCFAVFLGGEAVYVTAVPMAIHIGHIGCMYE